jgi:hypothetical protein
VRIRLIDYATPLNQQKLAVTSRTSGGRSVGIVRSRTQATEFVVASTNRLLTPSSEKTEPNAERS